MQLRDHPLMTRKSGMKSWPPPWVNASGDPKDKPRGEVGILQRVTRHQFVDNALFLWIEYQDSTYVGSVYFDDLAFYHVIGRVLESQIGVSIKEIGDIDLSFTL